MLESGSNGAAWFACAAAGPLHEAAVSHLLEPCIRRLAGNSSVDNRASADGTNEDREFGKVGRIRLLTTVLYLGTVALAYNFGCRFYGRFSAAVIGFVLATSAGFIAYAHFLTADSALLFWMLAAFWFAQQITFAPNAWNYGIAGFLTGI